MDLDRRILSWNAGASRNYGYAAEEVVGKDSTILYVPEDVASGRADEFLATAYEKETAEGEFGRVRKDGSQFMANVVVTRRNDPSGNPIGYLVMSSDISDKKLAEEELAKYRTHLEDLVASRSVEIMAVNKRLEQINAELEAFAYSVSHDLRTPLRAVAGFAKILADEYAVKLDAEGLRLLNVVRDGANSMSRLIDDILAFSRIGRLEMANSHIDMEETVRATIKAIEPLIAARQVAIDIRQPLPPCRGDAAMMRQVWGNLLGNAVKFTETRPQAIIEIGATVENAETTYYIKDNGVGFDMRYAAKLFGVFQRLHSDELFEGTGIGLAIVKRIVSRHGGRVWAEGRPNEGATFYFTLPAEDESHD
jgi:PAS domain S-box-containing protein